MANPDFLNMSDEELMNFNPADVTADDSDNTETGADTSDEDTDTADIDADTDDDKQDDNADDAGEGADDDSKSEDQDDSEADGSDDAADAKSDADKAPATDEGKADPAKADSSVKNPVEKKDVGDGKAKSGDEGAKDESVAIDYKAAYDKLTAPFKANGRDIQVKTVEEAVSLMQMGANYNKKMAGLKPSLKLLKMLESAELLDESKLNFLIDLSKKDPAAINKLVKDSGIDPLDLTSEKADGYQPGKHGVSDAEMELDTVLDDLKGSEHYDRTLNVVASQWDKASKAQVAQQPQILGVINGHMQSGIYDIITAEIERERTFGRLKELSDLEAYRQVGDAIQERGGFNHLNGHVQKEKTAAPVVVKPKPKQADEDIRKEKKRAAASPKTSAPAKQVPDDYSPLGMSDEDFAKFKPI